MSVLTYNGVAILCAPRNTMHSHANTEGNSTILPYRVGAFDESESFDRRHL